MSKNKQIVATLAIAGLAFVIGRSDLFTSSTAQAQQPAKDKPRTPDRPQTQTPPAQPPGGDMDAGMAAWAKAGTPGEWHKYLEPSIGEFEAAVRFKMGPNAEWMESQGTVTREWVLGKRFVRETVEASSGMGPFSAIGYIGHNNYDGQYEMAWMESLSTAINFETGTYDPAKKVMTMRTQHRDPSSGHLMNGRGTWDLSNPDRQTYEGYTVGPDGKEFKSFEGVFERKGS